MNDDARHTLRDPDSERLLFGTVFQIVSEGRELEGKASSIQGDHYSLRGLGEAHDLLNELIDQGDTFDIETFSYKLSERAKKNSKSAWQKMESVDIGTQISRCIVNADELHLESHAGMILDLASRRITYDAGLHVARLAMSPNGHDPIDKGIRILEGVDRVSDLSDREQWTAAELAALDLPEEVWVLDGKIANAGVNLYAGAPGAGKTISMLDLCLTISSGGGNAWNADCIPGSVIYFGADNSKGDLQNSIVELAHAREIEIPHDHFLIDMESLNLDEPSGIVTIENMIKDRDPTMIVFDTFGYYLGKADLNDYGSIYQMIGRLRSLSNRFGTAFVAVHHLTKSGGDGKNRPLIERALGSTALVSATNNALILTSKQSGPIVERNMTHVKTRRGALSDPAKFVMIQSENGGLTLAFDRGDDDIATKTQTDALLDVVVNFLANSPGESYTQDDLKQVLKEDGFTPSTRTVQRIFPELKKLPNIITSRTGRKLSYIWSPIQQ